MHLIGFPATVQIEVVGQEQLHRKPARRHVDARVVVIAEHIAAALAVGRRSVDDIVHVDVVDALLVDAVIDHQEAVAAAGDGDLDIRAPGRGQREGDRYPDLGRGRRRWLTEDRGQTDRECGHADPV